VGSEASEAFGSPILVDLKSFSNCWVQGLEEVAGSESHRGNHGGDYIFHPLHGIGRRRSAGQKLVEISEKKASKLNIFIEQL
jgi:hypothetical protein